MDGIAIVHPYGHPDALVGAFVAVGAEGHLHATVATAALGALTQEDFALTGADAPEGWRVAPIQALPPAKLLEHWVERRGSVTCAGLVRSNPLLNQSRFAAAPPSLHSDRATRFRQVDGTDVQSFFGSAMVTPIVEDAGRVALDAVREEGQSPGVLVSEIPKPAEVERPISAMLEVLLTCFAQRVELASGGRVRLDVGVDVAQCAFEADPSRVYLPA